jgi:hypothetical protein
MMKLELEKDLPLPALETAAPGPTYRAVSDPFNQRSSMHRTVVAWRLGRPQILRDFPYLPIHPTMEALLP